MTPTAALFPDEPTQPARAGGEGAARGALVEPAAGVLMPNRNQLELPASDLESLLLPRHRTRLVWGYVERQNREGLYSGIKAVEGGAGRAANAPEILYALWFYATLEGVGDAWDRATDAVA